MVRPNRDDAMAPGAPMSVEFTVVGEEMQAKTPQKHGNGGRIYVPKRWVGMKVVLILTKEKGDNNAR